MIVPNNGTPPGATYNAVINTQMDVLLANPVTIEQLTLTGRVGPTSSSESTLTTNALSTLAAGGIGTGAGSFRLIANGGADITGNITLFTGSRLILAGGTSTWSGGDLSLHTGAGLTNAAGSTLLITGNNMVGAFTTITTSFTNDGLIRKLNSTGTSSLLGGRVTGTNNGAIEVLSGTLSVQSGLYPVFGTTFALNQSPDGSILVGPGATLIGPVFGGIIRGSGTIGGSESVFTPRTLAPGMDGPGVLTATAPITLNQNSTFVADLAGSTAGDGYDQLVLGQDGSINLGGSSLSVLLGYAPDPGDTLTLITGGPISGVFTNALPGQEFFLGAFGDDYYAATINYTPTSVFLDEFRVVPIPEPGSLILAAVAVTAAGFCRRRRASAMN